jgi:hypothetical protein
MDGKEINKVNRRTISFAYLSQANMNTGDLIGGIASIFRPIGKEHEGEIFEAESFSKFVDELYGLKIHPWAVEDLVPRLVKHGILYKQVSVGNAILYRYSEIENDFNKIDESDIEKVSREYISFSQPILNDANIKIDNDSILDAFFKHLVDMDFLSVAVRPKKDTVSECMDESIEESLTSKLNVLAASFVLYAYNQDIDLYDLIMKVVSGAMIAEVVLNFGEPAKDANLKRINVVLDTPFLMAYMDLSSEKDHVFTKEICDQLRKKGANLKVFEHSVDELLDNLKGVKHSFSENGAWGATARRLKSQVFSAYLNKVQEDVPSALRKFDVSICREIVSESSKKYFSDEEEKEFYGKLSPSQNPIARERDAKSLSMIMRSRNGLNVHVNDFHKINYVFLTGNNFIPDIATDYLIRNNRLLENEFPPVISGRCLAGLFWMLFGAEGKQLSRELLLSNCAAALEPKSDVLMKMMRFLEEMEPVQAELFENLVSDARTGQYLMQHSLGNADVLTQENSLEMFEKTKQSLIEKQKAESVEGLKKQAEINELNVEKVREELEGKSSVIFDEMERKRRQAEDENINLNAQVYEKDSSIRTLVESVTAKDNDISKLEGDLAQERNTRIEMIVKQKKIAIEVVVEKAKSYESRMEVLLLILIATIGFGLANVLPILEGQLFLKLICQAVLAFLAFLTAWKIPDLILSKVSRCYCSHIFNKSIKKNKIEFLDEFSIDLNSGDVIYRNASG